MEECELACLRGRARPIGRGLYRETYRYERFAIKVDRAGRKAGEVRERALAKFEHFRSAGGELKFLPKFYGVVVSAKKCEDGWSPVVVSFHEYVPPIRRIRIEDIYGILRLVERAAQHGYVLDLKPSNFGKKGGKYYYLDEYGLGRNPIPPDVREDFRCLFNQVTQALRKILTLRGRQ